MHPILEDRRRLAVYLLAWQLTGLLLMVGLRHGNDWGSSAALLLPLAYCYAFVSLSSWYVCRAFPLSAASSVARVAAAHFASATIAAVLWLFTGGLWSAIVDWSVPWLQTRPIYAQSQILLFVVGVLLYWLAAACHYLLIAFQASRDAEARALALTVLAREAELNALRAQLDPHFIFNSLHSISALTTIDAAAARRMCLLLAEFLRETLRLGANRQITMADELALIERFLAIEQVRLGRRLQIERDTSADVADCLVPPLLLQPLIENAVVHGVSQLIDGGTIRMTAARQGEMLTITIENPCDPDRARTRGVGLGLDLIRRRVNGQFGAAAAVQAGEEAGRFRVQLRIPAVTAA
jgi:two-component system, LytTR family, sensor histidine kinase AlgZ